MLLPLAFLWLWASCAAICGKEAADHSREQSSAELVEVKGAPECEGCPLVGFPEAPAPSTRAAYDASSQAPPPAPPPAPATGPANEYPALAQARRPPPPAAPPLELLPTLRV